MASSLYLPGRRQSIVHRYTGKAVDLCLFHEITPDMHPASADNGNMSTSGYT